MGAYVKKRLVFALFVLALVLLAVPATQQSVAAPPTSKPKPTKTPSPTPTPTPTATTASPTPTADCSPGTPITITAGGTYSGCYRSTDPAVPAVTVDITAAVIFQGARIEHKGQGIRACCSNRADVTVKDTTFVAIDPGGAPQYQEGFMAYQPAAVVLENNKFTNDHGILINGNNLATNPLQIKRNDFINIGRYGEVNCCLGAIHFDKVSAPNGASLSWNRVNNTYGQSLNGDVFGIYQSNGASGNPIMIDHNLINGAYPSPGSAVGWQLDGSDFTGSCINLGDSSGTWQTGDSNTGVNCTNNGLMISGGTGGNMTHTNSTTVSDGLAGIDDAGPRVSSTFGNGINAKAVDGWSGPIVVTNNQSGQRRWNGSAWESVDYYIPDATTASGNTSISPVNAAAEQAAVDAWESARAAANVTIGPR